MMRRRVVIAVIATAIGTLFLTLAPPGFAAPTGDNAAKGALRMLGVPYVYGGASASGFDTSGLTMYVFAQLNVSLPHNATMQYARGRHIARKNLRPGDLVFFGESTSRIHHVGIYIGNGRMVHAPHTGDYVRIQHIAALGDFAGATRLLPAPAGKRPTGRYAQLVARSLLDSPYVAGGASLDGFDTAGLTAYVYGRLGVRLPRTIAEQCALDRGKLVTREALRRGDLVFFGPSQAEVRLVGVYVGHDRMICVTPETKVHGEPLPADFLTGRRMLRPSY